MGITNEYESMKEMLDIMRDKKNQSRLLTENFDEVNPDESDESDESVNTDDIDGSKIEVNDEDNTSFQALFHPLENKVKTTELVIFTESENIIGRGEFAGERSFTFTFDMNKGLLITSIDFRLDESGVLSDINKLHGIYANWKQEWGKKIDTEYLNRRN